MRVYEYQYIEKGQENNHRSDPIRVECKSYKEFEEKYYLKEYKDFHICYFYYKKDM